MNDEIEALANDCDSAAFAIRVTDEHVAYVLRRAAMQLRRLSAKQGNAVPEGWHLIQKEPTPGVLMSMAIRFDHGLGCPGYHDQFGDGNHQRRLESTLRTMRQLYEEVTGTGFYSPDKEAYYANMAAAPEPPK